MGVSETSIELRAAGAPTTGWNPGRRRPAVRVLEQGGARRAVRERAAQRAASALEALPVPVVILDRHGRCTRANRAARDAIAATARGGPSSPQFDQLVADALELGPGAALPERDVEIDGRTFAVTAIVEGGRGRVPGQVVAVLRDVTSERERARQRRALTDQAVHEIRTPLASIQAYAELLVDEDPDPATRRAFLDVVQHEAARLGRLVDRMLDAGRLDAASGLEAIDLVAVVERAVGVVDPAARRKGIEIVSGLPSAPLLVHGDDDLLEQVVVNLTSNAIKYTRPGGSVRLEAQIRENGTVTLDVIDTGLGIEPGAVTRLFDPRFREEHARRVASGSGIGLGVCRHIVEHVHGGRIDVASAPGRGSRFRCELPAPPAITP